VGNQPDEAEIGKKRKKPQFLGGPASERGAIQKMSNRGKGDEIGQTDGYCLGKRGMAVPGGRFSV